jgi:ribosomal protein L37E
MKFHIGPKIVTKARFEEFLKEHERDDQFLELRVDLKLNKMCEVCGEVRITANKRFCTECGDLVYNLKNEKAHTFHEWVVKVAKRRINKKKFES